MGAILLGADDYTVYRRAEGQHVDGAWEPGAESSFEAHLQIDPVSEDDLAMMPEGYVGSAKLTAYASEDVLRAVNSSKGQESDEVVFKGTRHKVFKVKDLTHGPYSNVMYVLLDDTGDEAY